MNRWECPRRIEVAGGAGEKQRFGSHVSYRRWSAQEVAKGERRSKTILRQHGREEENYMASS